MSSPATVSVALPEASASVLDRAIERGEFPSREAAVEAAIGAWAAARLPRAADDSALTAMLQAGIDSGPGRDVDTVCDELIARYAALHRRS